MMEYRVRSKRPDDWIQHYQGAQVEPEMINLKLEGEARVLRPDGKPLCVYLPGAASDLSEQCYPEFTRIRSVTDNRGYASASKWFKDGEQMRAEQITSSIIGSFEATPRAPACRLTAFTAQQVDRWDKLIPYFQRISDLLEEHVPERFKVQAEVARRTPSEWIIRYTPFTTITVNNTYPTGMHTDKGDLDAGFSTLAVMRRGEYAGGWITFPQYGIAADMKDGDVLLMDAHEWHGNTALKCAVCDESLGRPGHVCNDGHVIPDPFVKPERISVVCYFRTKMAECGTAEEENARRLSTWEERNARKMGVGAQ